MSGPLTLRGSAALALTLCAGALVNGCGGSGGGAASDSGPVRVLSASEFAKAPAAADGDGGAAAATSEGGGRAEGFPVVTDRDASEGISDVIVVEGAPAVPAPVAGPAKEGEAGAGAGAGGASGGRTLVIDRSVGQINGRPIYASDFLADMDDRLRRNAERMKRPEWVKETFTLVGQKLRDQVRDELLLSEFSTNLKPEQKIGVAAFLDKVQEDLRSGNLGSETLANKRLLEEEGKTIQQKARDIGDKAFIQDWLRRTVYNRVQVTEREVRRYYENNPAEFREPGKAVFRIIQSARSDAGKLARIESGLAGGESFDTVAEIESEWRRNAKEGRFTLEVRLEKPLSEAEVFGPANLNAAARALSVGGRTDRIDAGASAWWLMLVSVTEARQVPLYDVQLAIERKIRNERYREEETRYFSGLLKRSSATNLEEMALKITEFADQRYWGEGRVSQPAAKAGGATAAPTPVAAPEPAQGTPGKTE